MSSTRQTRGGWVGGEHTSSQNILCRDQRSTSVQIRRKSNHQTKHAAVVVVQTANRLGRVWECSDGAVHVVVLAQPSDMSMIRQADDIRRPRVAPVWIEYSRDVVLIHVGVRVESLPVNEDCARPFPQFVMHILARHLARKSVESWRSGVIKGPHISDELLHREHNATESVTDGYSPTHSPVGTARVCSAGRVFSTTHTSRSETPSRLIHELPWDLERRQDVSPDDLVDRVVLERREPGRIHGLVHVAVDQLDEHHV